MPPDERSPREHARPPEVVVLGTDTLLAALPATSVQVVHACLAAGFDAVVPSSWGDELVAAACLNELSSREAGPVIQCSCPCVARRLTSGGGELEKFLLPLESPPVAVARYIRALYGAAPVSITFAGACPAAADSLIDRALEPSDFLALLAERGVSLGDQPVVFDSILPPDRRRHRSLPGGVPSPEALQEHGAARILVEIAAEAFAAELAEHLLQGESVLLDLAPRLGCACSGSVAQIGARRARSVVCSLEPPRASTPVVDLEVNVKLRTTPHDLAAVSRKPGECAPDVDRRSSGWHRAVPADREAAGQEIPERVELTPSRDEDRDAQAEVEAEPVRPAPHPFDAPYTSPAPPAWTAPGDDEPFPSKPEPREPEPRPYEPRSREPQRPASPRPIPHRPAPHRGVPRTYALARATSGKHRAVPDPSRNLVEEHAVGLATPPDAPATPDPADELPSLTPLLGTTIVTPPHAGDAHAEHGEQAEPHANGRREPRHAEGKQEPSNGEFDSFLSEIRSVVESSISDWRGRLRGAVAEWTARGFVTEVLERALLLPRMPDVEGLIATFEAAAAHLGSLEQRALSLAPDLAERLTGHPVFRDPARVADAELIVERLAQRSAQGASSHGAATGTRPHDGDETVPELVYEWNIFEECVIEELGDTPGFFRPQNGSR